MDATRDVPFEAIVEDAPTGLVGTMTVEVYDPSDSSVIIPETSVGITEPATGTYRVELTVSELGTFLIRWTYPVDQVAEEPLTVSVSTTDRVLVADITPTLDQVAALIPGRVAETGSNSFPVWDDTTSPTDIQVQGLIDLIAGEIYAQCEAITTKHAPFAKSVVALQVALTIERGFWPNEQEAAVSILDDLRSELSTAGTGKLSRLVAMTRLAWATQV